MGHIEDHKRILYSLEEKIESTSDYDLLKSELVYYEPEEHPRNEAGELDIAGINLYTFKEDKIYRIMDIVEVKSSCSVHCQTHARDQLYRAKKYFTEVYDENLFDEVNLFTKITDRPLHNIETDVDIPPQYLDEYQAAKSELDKMLIQNHGEN